VNTAGDNGDGAGGAGPTGMTFPEDYPVRFMTRVADGTNVTYNLDYGDGTVDSTNETFLEHQFSSPGTHTIHVHVNNSVSEFTFTITIVLEAVIKDITVENDSPIVYGTPITFTVTIGQLGNESCFYFKMKNDSFITFQPERTTACVKSDFSTDVRTFTGNSFTFEYIYETSNEYIVEIEGHNYVSSVPTDCRAVIVDKPCFYPKAVVIEVGKNVSTARQFIKSRDTVVPTENVIDCEAAVYRLVLRHLVFCSKSILSEKQRPFSIAGHFILVKNQSRGHAKKVKCSLSSRRVRVHKSRQKTLGLDTYSKS
jgi:hypothetical protein